MTVAPGVQALAEPVVPVRRSWIGLLFAANLGLWMAYFTPIQILLPEQIDKLVTHDKENWLSLVTGVGALVAVLINPIAGALSDRTRPQLLGRSFGRRHLWTLGGLVVAAISLFALAGARNLFTVTLCWAGAQIGLNVMFATLTAAVPDRVPVSQRGLVSGWIGMPQALGLVVGAVLVTAVVSNFGPGYVLMTIGMIALAAPFALLTPDDPLGSAPVAKLRWKLDLRANRDFAWAWGTRFLVMLGNAMGTLYLLYFLSDDVKVPDAADHLLYMILLYTAGMILTAMVGGWLSDRSARRKIFVIWSGVLITIAALLLALWPTWPVSMLASVVFGAGFGVYLAVDTALITQVLPAAADRAKDLGVINVATALPQVLGPAMAAPIVTYLGGYPALFGLTALVSIAGAVAVVRIRSVR